ncbi:hypothetical protein MJI47_30715, partial [Salmonella enterica subsp. enterica serovar Kentucky]|nr:hypothetical protein [Salmonella enterica subsp. enterica serovar Kentucky]
MVVDSVDVNAAARAAAPTNAYNYCNFALTQPCTLANASGRMTALGVSTPRPEVIDAAMAGMNQYFEMKDLVNKTGEY